MRRPLGTWAILLVLLMAGCATAGPTTEGAAGGGTQREGSSATALLAERGLGDRTAAQVVDALDAMALAERPADLMASVRPDELVLTDGSTEAALPMPEDRFYLSVAPYVDRTHECFHHSLTTCQGELAGEEVGVRITTTDGDVLVDRTRRTWANGFVGFWLPRDVEGTVEVRYAGRSGRADFATRADSPTCLTTLRLT